MNNEKRPNPTATLVIGIWTLALETKRMTIRTEKPVRSSDTGDGNRGTLLRVEKHSMKMVVHTVNLTSSKGAKILLSICIQGKRTTCTKTMPSDRTTPSDKSYGADQGTPDIKVSYSIREATALLTRILGLDAKTVELTILAPLPDEEAEGSAYVTVADLRQNMVECAA